MGATTRLVIKRRRMVLGGREHSVWLPEGAAVPRPTPVTDVLVDFLIEGGESGAILYWNGSDGSRWNYWRESVEGAIEQAEFSWGVRPEEWELA